MPTSGLEFLKALFLARDAAAAELPKGSRDGPGAGRRFSRQTREQARQPDCLFCGDPTSRQTGPNQSTIDHVIPRSRGGTNLPENAANLCLTCNQDKGSLTMDEYLERLKAEQHEINRINKLPPGERAGPLGDVFRKRWQTLRRWGGLHDSP